MACYPGLAPDVLLACEQAIIRFQEIDSVSGTIGVEIGVGLGPAFNGNSCAMCHAEPAVLGASPGLDSPQEPVPNPQIALATLDGAENVVPPFITPEGPVREVRFPSDNLVHNLFTIRGRVDAPGCEAMQPDFKVPKAFRTPTPLFGLGLVENVPDSELEKNLAANCGSFGTGGTFNFSPDDGTIMRFGWKAQSNTLLRFATNAYNVEQGVTNEGFAEEKTGGASNLKGCLAFNPTPEDTTNLGGSGQNTVSDVSSDVTNFGIAMRVSKPATPATPPFAIGSVEITQAEIDQGRETFGLVGCASCHTPTLTTAASSIDPVLSNVSFHPYSDFAIHHMGPKLADGIVQEQAGPDQFRTAPLWGIGQRLYFLHDGRTSDLVSAIEAHGGDATIVIANFDSLPRYLKLDLVYFLRSL
ncbi:MAG TPA: di-heme oxidoredictase family protein [Polyangiaceae bacterium]